jgi:hypothetical protein
MHELTGSQVPHDWRTDELRHVGDDLRRQREANARRAITKGSQPGIRGWVGRHLVAVGRSVAGEPARPRPCPEQPKMGGHTTAA